MQYYIIVPLILLLLYLGKSLIIPLCFSFIIYLILKSLSKKISLINPSVLKLGYYSSFFLVCTIVITCFYFVGILVQTDLSKVIDDSYVYQSNIQKILTLLEEKGIIVSLFSVDTFLKNLDLASILSKILNFFTNAAGNIFLIFLYIIFFLIEEKFFEIKFQKIFLTSSKKRILEKINFQIYEYFELKTLTSLLTGILTFVCLIIFSNDLAILFGILAFLFNFIPFIGSLFSIILPFLFSILQTLDFGNSLLIVISLSLIQILIGNFIEPKLMGKSLNLSPIIMLISLGIFGKIWGISGMFLTVPILVIVLIIFTNFNKTKKIAVLISEKGDLK